MSNNKHESYHRQCERKKLFESCGYNIEQEFLRIIERVEPMRFPILEIGTGKGYFAGELAKKKYSFITLDVSAEEQGYARDTFEYLGLSELVAFEIGDAEDINHGDNMFGTIFAVNVFHHLEKPFVVFDEMMRVLGDTGRLVMSDFNSHGLEIVERMHAREGRTHSKKGYTLSDLVNYMKGQDLRFEHYKTECQETVIVQGKGK